MTRRAVTVLALAAVFSLSLLAGCGGGGDAEKAAEKAAAETKAKAAEGEKKAMDSKPVAAGDRTAIAGKLGVDLADLVKGERGLEWIVRQEGSGDVPVKGQKISAHYTGYLLNGTKFDSSVDRGQPFETAIGVGRVIAGWDMAFTDMKVGEKRVLFIPPALGYGARGAGSAIPPNADLVFDVELLGIVE